jgi:hypothetical protein
MGVEQVQSPSGIRMYLPILAWLSGYSSAWLRLDVAAAQVEAVADEAVIVTKNEDGSP